MDVDSTFITAEVIELIADHAGTRDEVARITEAAMRGELDFAESLRERVATLAGIPAAALSEVAESVVESDGAAELMEFTRGGNWATALVSGGFIEIVQVLAHRWGIDYARANQLEVGADGLLTGRVIGPVIDRAAKAAALFEFAEREGVALADTVAIGDGANDLDMIQTAGLGIAFRAKPVLAEQADAVITGSLAEAIPLLERS